MELNYKASNIAKAERIFQENFFTMLSRFSQEANSMSDIIFVLVAGGLTEDEASDLIDSDLIEAIKQAMIGLAGAGFLAKSPEVQVAKAQIEKDLQATSQSTGKTAKA